MASLKLVAGRRCGAGERTYVATNQAENIGEVLHHALSENRHATKCLGIAGARACARPGLWCRLFRTRTRAVRSVGATALGKAIPIVLLLGVAHRGYDSVSAAGSAHYVSRSAPVRTPV